MDRQRTFWVMDIEILVNAVVLVFIDFKSNDKHIFIIHDEVNDFPRLIAFLKENVKYGDWHFGFNNINFDAQLIQHMIKFHKKLEGMTIDELATEIYNYGQHVINTKNNGDFLDYPEWKLSIPILDVFKINHWDNKNKLTSLKWAQYQMDWENVEEMPHEHFMPVNDKRTLNEIVDYCINDVLSTKRVIELSISAVKLRISLKNKYKIPCINYSNTKIGSELLMDLFCKKTGQDKKIVKKSRTIRPFIKLKDVLFPYVEFRSNTFKDFLTKLKSQVIYNTKGDFKEVVDFMGYEFHYGLGGIHQCIKKGVYKDDAEWVIIDADVASLYPSIAVVNKMYPKHLGPAFYEVYKNDIVDVRLAEKVKPKADRDNAIISGFKEAANASYGNSNSGFSWLFDSEYTMRTTVNGQLMLSMLVEDLLLELDGAILLQTNTDGLTLKIRRTDLVRYYEICRAWEAKTNLILEYAEYSQMVIADVNSYLAQYKSGDVKCKGRFAWEEFDAYAPSHLSKNKSHLIIAKAIYQYFINGIKPEDFVYNHKNIYDFCAGIKLKGKWFFEEQYFEKGKLVQHTHKKILRYYISNKGCKLIKKNPDGREIQTESGPYMQTLMNQYVSKPWAEYDINYKYYIDKIYEEINAIDQNSIKENKQLTLSF